MVTINYSPDTKVWVRLEGKKKMGVFKGPAPSLWGGSLYCVTVGGKELALDPDSILGIYGSSKRH